MSGFASIRPVRLARVSVSVSVSVAWVGYAQFHDGSGAVFRLDGGSPIQGHLLLQLRKVLHEPGLQRHWYRSLLPLWLNHTHHILEARCVHFWSVTA